METLARQIGETLVAHGTAAAVTRWGVFRVAGWVGLAALIALYFTARHRAHLAAPQLAAPALPNGRDAAPPDQERRRTPEPEQGVHDEPRTLH